ncbi:hypothetical protein QJ857_gp0031 [Tupanvirus soda lake]|uniref:Microbial-type PARG catalytic domain-containing protein n=2 Tax=Tupanvirus TaxID=2094720 RepID=A0A6N1NI35_9VIRU|nr:hypothetical protein QJ857_gp0031 [Tupanvirus soda lake]QKU34679.1 hypothetical protein [Tupanvirus soda lake]
MFIIFNMIHMFQKNNQKKIHQNRLDNPLVSIYQHTIEYCRKEHFPVYRPCKYDFASSDFSDDVILSKVVPFENPAMVLVENIDSFDMARKLNNTDTKVMVLNLASDVSSGGGVVRGAKAQEEDLYRKSNYFEANSQNLYPLKNTEVVYSPLVHVIKDRNYKLLQTPYPVSCLAVAALRKPRLNKLPNGKDTYFFQSEKEIMQDKINMIFKVAIKHGHSDLVLGALGCGVFCNPNEEVALMFKNALNKYGHYFKRIGFAILSGSGNTNFDIFKNIITP